MMTENATPQQDPPPGRQIPPMTFIASCRHSRCDALCLPAGKFIAAFVCDILSGVHKKDKLCRFHTGEDSCRAYEQYTGHEAIAI
jgi:hypothetical protein